MEAPPVARLTGALHARRRGRKDRPAPEDPAWDALLPPGGYARHGRRLFGLALTLLGLAPALLVAVPVALLCALEHGPRGVLFTQPRVGRRGRTFRLLKFRTLSTGAREGRPSRLGRWLRRTHQDELPQLVNVLRGDMDLVGPRPETVAIDAWARAHLAGFHRRNAVRPGLTGLAQITQGYAEPEVEAYAEKLALDLRSLERVTLRGDLALLARTVPWVLLGRGARVRPRDELRPEPPRRYSERR